MIAPRALHEVLVTTINKSIYLLGRCGVLNSSARCRARRHSRSGRTRRVGRVSGQLTARSRLLKCCGQPRPNCRTREKYTNRSCVSLPQHELVQVTTAGTSSHARKRNGNHYIRFTLAFSTGRRIPK